MKYIKYNTTETIASFKYFKKIYNETIKIFIQKFRCKFLFTFPLKIIRDKILVKYPVSWTPKNAAFPFNCWTIRKRWYRLESIRVSSERTSSLVSLVPDQCGRTLTRLARNLHFGFVSRQGGCRRYVRRQAATIVCNVIHIINSPLFQSAPCTCACCTPSCSWSYGRTCRWTCGVGCAVEEWQRARVECDGNLYRTTISTVSRQCERVTLSIRMCVCVCVCGCFQLPSYSVVFPVPRPRTHFVSVYRRIITRGERVHFDRDDVNLSLRNARENVIFQCI